MTSEDGQPVLVDVSGPVADSTKRLNSLPGIHKRFGVIRLWPELQVAEHECIERLRRAAEMIGAEVIDLDRYSRPIGKQAAGDLDFVLNLHFDSPKCSEDISIGALWNPFQFYFDFGFERVWSNQMSHDLFAWTGSEQIKRLVAAERGSASANMAPLNHTIAEPIFVPTAKSHYNAFYCGINWERLAAKRGRHHEFLTALDRLERLQVYGPREMRGVPVWEGFAGYQGTLPFDGQSVVRKAWECGATLVLSSDAHKASGIMSSRFFEAAAAGSVILGDDHPFIRQALGESYVEIPKELSAAKRAGFVDEALAEFEKDPHRAVSLAKTAQARLLDGYFLCAQLAGLFEAAERLRARREVSAAKAGGMAGVNVVVQTFDREVSEIEKFASHLRASFGTAANLILLSSPARSAEFRKMAGATVVEISAAESSRILDIVSMFNTARHALVGSKVIFALGIETYLGSAAVAAAAAFPTSSVGRLGFLARRVHDNEEHYAYFADINSANAPDVAATGSYVFDRSWLEQHSAMPGLSPHGLTRLASHGGATVAISYPTALSVDLEAWETLVHRGYLPTNWSTEQNALVDRIVAKQIDVNGEVFVVPPGQGGSFYPPERTIESALSSLRPEARLGLARDLFDALPIPGWSKRLMRMMRRR